jgi:hypothetical protein
MQRLLLHQRKGLQPLTSKPLERHIKPFIQRT